MQLKNWSNIKPTHHVYFTRAVVVLQWIIHHFVQFFNRLLVLLQQFVQGIRRKLGFIVPVQVPNRLPIDLRKWFLLHSKSLQPSVLHYYVLKTYQSLPSLNASHNDQLQKILRTVLVVLLTLDLALFGWFDGVHLIE